MQIPNGIILAAGDRVKITITEIFVGPWNGWAEVEFYGVKDLELINQLMWREGKNNLIGILSFTNITCLCVHFTFDFILVA